MIYIIKVKLIYINIYVYTCPHPYLVVSDLSTLHLKALEVVLQVLPRHLQAHGKRREEEGKGEDRGVVMGRKGRVGRRGERKGQGGC
jgi:hypothetical protein